MKSLLIHEALDKKIDKKGQLQVATSFLLAIGGFILTAIIVMLFIGVLVDGGFFTAASSEQAVLNNLSSNVSSGISTIGSKLPTAFTIIAIVLILAFIAILFVIYQRMKLGGGGGNAFG